MKRRSNATRRWEVVRGGCKGPKKQRKFNDINDGKQKDRLLFVSEQTKSQIVRGDKKEGA
jgi:hypothetical protein